MIEPNVGGGSSAARSRPPEGPRRQDQPKSKGAASGQVHRGRGRQEGRPVETELGQTKDMFVAESDAFTNSKRSPDRRQGSPDADPHRGLPFGQIRRARSVRRVQEGRVLPRRVLDRGAQEDRARALGMADRIRRRGSTAAGSAHLRHVNDWGQKALTSRPDQTHHGRHLGSALAPQRGQVGQRPDGLVQRIKYADGVARSSTTPE